MPKTVFVPSHRVLYSDFVKFTNTVNNKNKEVKCTFLASCRRRTGSGPGAGGAAVSCCTQPAGPSHIDLFQYLVFKEKDQERDRSKYDP